MKATTLENRLSKISISKSAKAYTFAKQVISGTKTIRPRYTSNVGRFCSNQDHTELTCNLLDQLKIKYTLTNDAPRGSATGNLITIKTKIL